MPQWTIHSNVADMLSLGPRTAGRLMQVGVRSVADLLAARPPSIAERLDDQRMSAATIEQWQREARLILAAPQLPPHAARWLAAIGIASRERIAGSTPTELLGALETAIKESDDSGWLEKNLQPSVSELAVWIRCARSASTEEAA